MDFGALPPEINSARMYTGPGAGPLIGAANTWSMLATELSHIAAAHASVITALTATWSGPSSLAAAASLGTFGGWLEATATRAEHTATAAGAAVEAYGSAFAAIVPPAVVAANRAQLLILVATNLFGQNTGLIAANEAVYGEMWAQDGAAMYAYSSSSSAATGTLPQFTPAPQTTSGSPPAAATQAASTPPWLQFIQTLVPGYTVGQPLQNLAELLVSPLGNALISSGSFTQLPADLLMGLLALMTIDTVVIEQQTAAAAARSPQIVMPAPPTVRPVEARPVAAGAGVGSQIGGLSVPPAWAHQPKTAQASAGQSPAGTPLSVRGQTAIPAVPFMPVTSAGRSNQAKVRTDPEYGHVSKVVPPRHPAAG